MPNEYVEPSYAGLTRVSIKQRRWMAGSRLRLRLRRALHRRAGGALAKTASPAMTKVLFGAEQCGKLLLAVAGEVDDAVAGRAARPFQLVEPVQDRSAQRAGE